MFVFIICTCICFFLLFAFLLPSELTYIGLITPKIDFDVLIRWLVV